MADTVLTPKEFAHEFGHKHGMYVHVDPSTLVVNASHVAIDGAGGSAFIPFTSPAPVTISVSNQEENKWISYSINDKGVELFFEPVTSALDDSKREATVTLQSGETSIEIPVTQTWPQDRGFSLMTDAIKEVEAEGGVVQVILQTDQHWTVDCGESWVTYDQTFGAGSAKVTVTVAESKEPVMRYSILQFSAGKQKLTVEIRQKPAKD